MLYVYPATEEHTMTNPLIADPNTPVSPAQREYLVNLFDSYKSYAGQEHALRAKFDFQVAALIQSKGQASAWIDQVKQDRNAAKTSSFENLYSPSNHAAVTFTALTPKLQQGSLTTTVTPLPAYGYYNVDGTVYEWAKGNPAAKQISKKYDRLRKLHVSKSYTMKDEDGEPKVLKISWVKYGGLSAAKKYLTGCVSMTAKEVGALGKKYGFCVRCSKALSDPISLKNGLGATCLKYWGSMAQ